MAASTRIVSLNLGSQTVGLAEFRALPNDGLVLIGYRLREILGEHGNETGRNAQITTAVSEMMTELGIKSGAVGLRAFCETAGGRGRKDRTDHRVRGAAECAVSAGGSGLGLPARGWRRG